jgi:hypothetical protein
MAIASPYACAHVLEGFIWAFGSLIEKSTVPMLVQSILTASAFQLLFRAGHPATTGMISHLPAPRPENSVAIPVRAVR